jgi:hypothetical protein
MSISFKQGGEVGGTSLQGYVTTTYADLVQTFGEPTRDGDGYKVDAEWIITFADGVVATIYNYKDGRNYCGEDGLAVEDITEWHVGGYGRTGVESRVRECLNAACENHAKETVHHSKVEHPLGRTFEQVMAASKPMVKSTKEYNINMSQFRDALMTAQNAAVDVAEGIRQRDGTIPRDRLIEYTTVAAEAKILNKIINAMDFAKV